MDGRIVTRLQQHTPACVPTELMQEVFLWLYRFYRTNQAPFARVLCGGMGHGKSYTLQCALAAVQYETFSFHASELASRQYVHEQLHTLATTRVKPLRDAQSTSFRKQCIVIDHAEVMFATESHEGLDALLLLCQRTLHPIVFLATMDPSQIHCVESLRRVAAIVWVPQPPPAVLRACAPPSVATEHVERAAASVQYDLRRLRREQAHRHYASDSAHRSVFDMVQGCWLALADAWNSHKALAAYCHTDAERARLGEDPAWCSEVFWQRVWQPTMERFYASVQTFPREWRHVWNQYWLHFVDLLHEGVHRVETMDAVARVYDAQAQLDTQRRARAQCEYMPRQLLWLLVLQPRARVRMETLMEASAQFPVESALRAQCKRAQWSRRERVRADTPWLATRVHDAAVDVFFCHAAGQSTAP